MNTIDYDFTDRMASWDFCYNYFERNTEVNKEACMHLGFYLSSYGMYRGSSFISKKSAKYLEKVVEVCMENPIFHIDVNNYDKYSDDVLVCKDEIEFALEKSTETLITKIMMGVFGCVPAFDIYFKKWCGFKELDEDSMEFLQEFYNKNKKEIDDIDVFTYDWDGNVCLPYPIARKIDIHGFTEGKSLYKN